MANACRVYVGGLRPDVTERELEDEFGRFGQIRSIWVARKPPGFAFVEFEDTRDADDAVRHMDGVNGWRVEASRRPPGGRRDDDRRGGHDDFRGPPRGRGELRCYECNEIGHIARDCRMRGGGGGRRSPPRRGYSPRRRSVSPRGRSHSPPRGRRASPSPRRDDRSPPRRRASPPESPRDRGADRDDSRERRRDSPADGGRERSASPRERSRSR